ncbi:Hypothetical predicted protein [Pelobates cultripes]|nr:Hypothetical predicted protein [Pelobates cultripes]
MLPPHVQETNTTTQSTSEQVQQQLTETFFVKLSAHLRTTTSPSEGRERRGERREKSGPPRGVPSTPAVHSPSCGLPVPKTNWDEISAHRTQTRRIHHRRRQKAIRIRCRPPTGKNSVSSVSSPVHGLWMQALA